MQIYNGETEKDDRAYLVLFGRPIGTSYDLQDVSDGVDPGTRRIVGMIAGIIP